VRHPRAEGRILGERKARQSAGAAQIAEREPLTLLHESEVDERAKSNNKLEIQTIKFSYLGLSYDLALYCARAPLFACLATKFASWRRAHRELLLSFYAAGEDAKGLFAVFILLFRAQNFSLGPFSTSIIIIRRSFYDFSFFAFERFSLEGRRSRRRARRRFSVGVEKSTEEYTHK
jgi:hypothetical protein